MGSIHLVMANNRARVVARHLAPKNATDDAILARRVNDLQACKRHLQWVIAEQKLAVPCTKLAWHDSYTGGTRGLVVLAEGEDAELDSAINMLRDVKASYPCISWADIIQMACAIAIEMQGGPRIPLRYGRRDDDALEVADANKTEAIQATVRNVVNKAAQATQANLFD